ncbi:MAG: hypothetical protein WCJ60_00040 [bacterium]
MNDSVRASLDFQPGYWTNSVRRYMANELRPAIKLAEQYLENSLGIESTATRVLPYLGKYKEPARGGSISLTTFDLYFRSSELKYKKLGSLFPEITSVCAHEMVRCTREKYFPQDYTLIEIIASEGLAHVVQASVEHDIFKIPKEHTILEDNIDGEDVLDNLYSDPLFYEQVPYQTPKNQSPHSWLYEKNNNYSWGARLGAWCVNKMTNEQGYELNSLLAMPAEDIITL